ncbi:MULTISPECIES: hypothetical protein [Microbacterium]|uniref:Uncharacterized protein n=1 Tax=Microbacterium hominis TaxID=162426 RepID=A0A2K9D977_9MICO|nr:MULTISPECIES: hypothetical protein [Microbacterium]AUG29432.1 hypothetical protein CXR34_08130 [Microbacterium hominis]EPD84123.1 hypothetical protein HMPREF1529_02163 [Microbacterium sp. oral taxon 186 str. F0373]
MKLSKISAGRYLLGHWYIIRTEWKREGPRGGSRWLWELGEADEHGDVVLDGLTSFPTLREAVAWIRAEDGKDS